MTADALCLPGGVVCTLDGVDFAMALPAVRTALPLSDLPPPLPRRAGACVGLVTLEGSCIPLLDLRRWLQWPSPERTCPGDAQVALILQWHGRQVAIKVDATKAVLREPLALTTLAQRSASGEDLFQSAVSVPAMGALPVLDEERLFALCEVWQQAADDGKPATTASPAPVRSEQNKMLLARLRIGSQQFCIPSAEVVAVDVMPAISSIALQSALRGYTSWRGRKLPVLPTALLGADGQADTPYLAVVQHAGAWAGIPVSATEGVHAQDMTVLRPAAEAGLCASALVRGLLATQEGGHMALLDAAALTSFCPLGNDTAPSAQDTSLSRTGPLNTSAHMIVKGRHDWALPMDEVIRVTTLPDNLVWQHGVSGDGQPWSVAHMIHEGRSLAVWNIDARVLEGQDRQRAAAGTGGGHSVVIVRTGDSEAGVVFDTPQKIVAASACRRVSLQGQGGRRMHLVLTRQADGNDEHTYALWDHREQLGPLQASAAARAGPAAAGTCTS
ncbi:chemotaxis protein CheW [Herbaspirillum huttiense]|uniref:chemotaxis protein CheW n=1 Tax=Herbaspirillum huttiense TaxID=863372 RepID=UPI0039AFEA2D